MPRAAAIALSAAILALCALHVAFTLSTVTFYALQHPLQDEFRTTYKYLVEPFPGSILSLEQGHRPVLPALLRWIELTGMGGSHALQATFAAIAGALSIGLLGRESWKGLNADVLLQAAALGMGVTLLAWNANARMFFHIPEAAHTVLAGAGAVVAAWASARALEAGNRASWWVVALLACVVATFSIGPGAGSLATVIAICLIGRVRFSVAASVVAASLALLALYAGAPPSMTDPAAALLFWLFRMGAVAAELTRHKETVSFAASFFSVAMIIALFVMRRRRHDFSRVEAFSAGLFVFGAAANAGIVLMRTDYFFAHRDQLFAERYLPWTCIAWAGMAVFFFARLERTDGALRRIAAAMVVVLLLIAFFPPAKRVNGWAADRYTEVEFAAAILRIGAKAERPVRLVVDRSVTEAYQLDAQLRIHRVGDYRFAPEMRLGSHLVVEPREVPSIRLAASAIAGPTEPSPLFRLSGSSSGVEVHRGVLWLVDRRGRVVGSAFLAPRKAESLARMGIGYLDRLDGCSASVGEELLLVESVGPGRNILRARIHGVPMKR
jgi:hypothetical protein